MYEYEFKVFRITKEIPKRLAATKHSNDDLLALQLQVYIQQTSPLSRLYAFLSMNMYDFS